MFVTRYFSIFVILLRGLFAYIHEYAEQEGSGGSLTLAPSQNSAIQSLMGASFVKTSQKRLNFKFAVQSQIHFYASTNDFYTTFILYDTAV